jgi:hypothetical protein
MDWSLLLTALVQILKLFEGPPLIVKEEARRAEIAADFKRDQLSGRPSPSDWEGRG